MHSIQQEVTFDCKSHLTLSLEVRRRKVRLTEKDGVIRNRLLFLGFYCAVLDIISRGQCVVMNGMVMNKNIQEKCDEQEEKSQK